MFTPIIFAFLLLLNQASFAGSEEIQAPSPVPDIKVKIFAIDSLFAVYDFNHTNIKEHQKATAKMFSGEGWTDFLSVIKNSKLMDSVIQHKYVVTTSPLLPARISKQALKQGVYYWIVEYPAMIVFKNDDYQQVQYVNIKERIIYKDKVLQIDKFLATKGKALNCEETSKGITVPNDAATGTPAKK